MKNLYKTIEQNLKAGLNVVVKYLEDNNYCAIDTNKDFEGNYRYSGWKNSIEETKKHIGEYPGSNKHFWDEQDLEIVEVYRPEYEPFKVGQKVKLLDSIKKIAFWKNIEDDFPDMTVEIRLVRNDASGLRYSVLCNEKNYYDIGHEYLAPLYEEVEEEVIKVGDQRYNKCEDLHWSEFVTFDDNEVIGNIYEGVLPKYENK